MLCSIRRSWISFICNSTIFSISFSESGENMMISSMRLRNSGRNAPLSAFSIFSCDSRSSSVSAFCAKPSAPPLRTYSVPRLEVMMMIVLRKSTTLPWPSVMRPSSRICRSAFQTSGCAFSISSKSRTRYGRRRTASVSCPPSS